LGEGALGTLRLQASSGDIEADHAIGEVRHRLDDAVQKGDIPPEVLMLMARAFARSELDPGRTLQQAIMTAMEAQSPSVSSALTPAEISDQLAELAAALDNDPFEIYAELATTAAAFPPDHHTTMAGALAISDNEAAREAALGFAFSLDPAMSSAALVAVSQQGRAPSVSNKAIDRLVRMRAPGFGNASTDWEMMLRTEHSLRIQNPETSANGQRSSVVFLPCERVSIRDRAGHPFIPTRSCACRAETSIRRESTNAINTKRIGHLVRFQLGITEPTFR
jgi:hypothetical protein